MTDGNVTEHNLKILSELFGYRTKHVCRARPLALLDIQLPGTVFSALDN